MDGARRKSCPYCTRKHLASARRTLWELENHGDDREDPHLEILIGDLEHAEQQSPYPQLTQRIRAIKLVFDDHDIWDVKSLQEFCATGYDFDAEIVRCIMELRELDAAARELLKKQLGQLPHSTDVNPQ